MAERSGRERFASAKRGGVTLLLSRLTEYTRQASTRQSGQAREETDADMFKRTSLAPPYLTQGGQPKGDQTCVSKASSGSGRQQVTPTRKKGVVPTVAQRKN